MRKRLLATLLVLCMALTLLPADALATEVVDPAGTVLKGTQGDPNGPVYQTGNDTDIPDPGSEIIRYANEDNGAELTVTVTGIITGGKPGSDGAINIPKAIPIPGSDTGETIEVTSIKSSAFMYSTGLMSITIPDSVATIGTGAFWGCSRLTSITIPKSVSTIENQVFWQCSSLTSITIPDSVTTIGAQAFYECSSLTSITVPGSVTTIGTGAFFGCHGLTSITIPDGVISIGAGVCSNCKKLTDIKISSSNQAYAVLDGMLISKDPLSIISYPAGKTGDISIPSGVTTIGENSFSGCSGLTSITIPDSVTRIGDRAFNGCSSLADVYYAGSESQWKEIPIGEENDLLTSATIHYDRTDPVTYTVTVNGGTGGGNYEAGETVTITATVPDGQQFTGWIVEEGDVTLADSNSEETTFTMPEGDVTVTAAYEDVPTPPAPAQTYTVTVYGGTGGGDYEAGETVTITATVPDGQQFTGWIVEEGDVMLADSDSETTTFTMPEDNVTVTANYEDIVTPPEPVRTYTVTVNGGTGGGDYEAGETVTITATVPDGQQFTGWTVDEGDVTLADSDSEMTTFIMPEGDVTVTAAYEDVPTPPAPAQTYTVTVNGGTGGGDYEAGETVTITAIVPDGQRFTGWIVEEGDVMLADSDSKETSFIMPEGDVIVTATYEDIETYRVTVNGGTGSGSYEAGETVTIRAAVPDGQEFTGWIVDEGDVAFADSDSEETTFTMPASDVTVTARMIVVPPVPSIYKITFDANGGTGTMDDAQVNAGETFTFPACGFTAPAGKEFKAWRVGGQEYAPGDTYTVTGDMTVTAVWKAIVPNGWYTLTGTITGHKGVTYTSVTARLAGLNGSVYSAEVGEGVTNKTGKTDYSYSVTAPAGQYNLEVEARTDKGGVVNRTALVKLTGSGQTKNVNLPYGQAKVTVNNNGGTEALVGGLDELVIDADGEVMGEVTLTIDNVDKSSPDAAAIQSAAPGQTLEFMDISIIRSENELETAVTDTGDVTIQIVLTFDSTGKKDIAVYRYHDGSVDTLTTQVSRNGERIEIDDDSLTIYAKKFSVYAIGYTVSDSDPVIPSNPTIPSQPDNSSGSSDNSNYSNYSNYSISIPADITGGTVSASRKSAAKGSTVTLTVTADEGYELLSLTVTDRKGNELELTDKGNGKYAFIMPGSAVTVSAVFKLIEHQPEAPIVPVWVNPFADVSVSAWYFDAVKFVNENGLMSGVSNTVFAPDANLSRAELAQILYNKEGKPAVSGGSAFTDVNAGAWHADAVTWAAANRIVGGYGNGLFGPDDNITREQLAVMLWRYAEEPTANRDLTFSDADQISGFAQAAVRWAVENGVLNGKGNNILDPKGFATRAEAAQMLKNYLDNEL